MTKTDAGNVNRELSAKITNYTIMKYTEMGHPDLSMEIRNNNHATIVHWNLKYKKIQINIRQLDS